MAKTIDVKVPDIGNYKDVPVIEVLVKNGERVEENQPLLVLESDKATLEVPSPKAGVISGLSLKAGAKLSEGDVICQLEIGEAAGPAAPPPKVEAPAPAAKKAAEPAPQAALPLSPPPASVGGLMEVRVPDIGNYKDVPVIEILVKNGDTVTKDTALVVLESDKATMEVPAPSAGVVQNLKVRVGDKLSQGDVLCSLQGGATTADVQVSQQKPQGAPARSAMGAAVEDRPTKATPAPQPLAAPAGVASGSVPYAGPATRKFARELGVDLSRVSGSGARGRIVIEDVQNYVKSAMKGGAMPAPTAAASGGAGIPAIPAQDFSLYGEIESRPLSRIRKLSAAHLQRAWLNIPHVTQFDEADISELEAFRKSSSEESGTKLTLLPFIMKAVGVALKAYPEFNASLAPDGENLILKKYCHMGFAADTPNGLVVPVVRDVWSKGIVQLGNECGELAKKARDGKLKPDEMKGGCFSISSLGGLGVTGGFTPIVNAPEVAILGVSRATMKPVWDGKAFQPRLMLPLSLSYDHRVIDGAYAARFMVQLTKSFADLRRLML